VIKFKFQRPNHISGITEAARIVKFLARVGYIKCYQTDDISPAKLAYSHVTVFKFCLARVCQRQLILVYVLVQCTYGLHYKYCVHVLYLACQLITGSIARSASRRYLVYAESDFEVFRPAGATRCTDGGEI